MTVALHIPRLGQDPNCPYPTELPQSAQPHMGISTMNSVVSTKVPPKDHNELRQGRPPNLGISAMYTVMSAKVLPKDPKYPYSPEVPQGTRYSLV